MKLLPKMAFAATRVILYRNNLCEATIVAFCDYFAFIRSLRPSVHGCAGLGGYCMSAMYGL